MYILNSASKIALLLIIIGIFVLTYLGIDINEPLKTISLMVVSFYFGWKTKSKEIE